MWKLIASFLLAFVLASPTQATDRSELAKIKQMTLLLSPEIAKVKNTWDIALILRDQVHRHSVQETSIPYATTPELLDSATVYQRSLLTRERSNACQGLAILYMLSLKAYGIESRQVQMFASSVAWTTVWSHSSVDAWIDGEWVAMDPTFNISLRDGAGQLQSWSEALTLAKSDQTVVMFSDGRPVKTQLAWTTLRERYGHRLVDLADRVVLGPSPRSGLEILGSWDGRIDIIGGQIYDARAGAEHEIFKRLAIKGPGMPIVTP